VPRGGKTHLNDCGCREDRHSFDRVIANPWQQLLIEMVEPGRHRTALAKTKQRVIERRICRIGGFRSSPEPESLPIPRIEGQPARICCSVEIRRLRKVVPGHMAACSDRWKWIAIFGCLP
jgi:hypothetical protein